MPFDRATAWAVLSYAALVVLPGAALVRLARPRTDDAVVRLGLAIGAGLALQPLLYLWASVAGVPLGAAAWRAVLGGSFAALAIAVWRGRRSAPRTPCGAGRGRAAAPALAMALLVGMTLAARWWAARALTVPLWGDSVHHAMIVRLLVDRAGLPGDWLPLAPLSTFTYHFGMHAGVATLAALTGLPAHRALLVAGQVLMVLQVVTAYALAAGLTGRRWAGVGAALAAAGLSPMPAWYVNWGRYTQLAGQVILPAAALAAAWAMRPVPDDERAPRGGAIALATLVAAGLALTHYIVAAFYVLFGIAVLAVPGAPSPGVRSRGVAAGRAAMRWAMVGFGVALAVAPWLTRLRASLLAQAAATLVTRRLPDPDVYGVVAPSRVWGDASLFVGPLLMGAALAAVLWGVRRRDRAVGIGTAWTVLLLLCAYPGLVGLPVTGPIKDFAVVIGLYVPLGLVIGAALGDVAAAARRAGARLDSALLAVTAVCGAALAWSGRDVVSAQHVLVTPADERAMAWIRANTPADAVFLVGCMPAYGDTVCAGDDAGWWLPLLADRQGTVPPITYGLESTVDPAFRVRVNALASAWRADLDAPATRAALVGAGVRYAFAGATGRALPRERLAASPYWQLVYDRDGVQLYAGPAQRAGAR